MAKTIRIRKVPKRAFDPTRPPSGLLLSQIQQLQAAVLQAVDSEGEAAECIRSLTALLERLRPRIVPTGHKDTPRRRRTPRQSRRAVKKR